MKRIFTHLFVAVLMMLSATSWAQSGTKTYTVSPLDGSYNKTDWCANWTSNSSEYPVTKIDVADGINNMNASTNNAAGGFEFAVGQNSPSTWSFSVMGGYVIESYSFDFVSKTSDYDLTISAAGVESMTSSSSSQTWSVSGVNAQTASFQLSGGNNKIIVTNLEFTVRERQFEEGKVYRFVNRNTGRALNAYNESIVNAVAPDATSLQQQWYVTKEGDYFVLRNLCYAKYLKGAHVNRVAWSLTDDYSQTANNFTFAESDKYYSTLETKGWTSYGFMHDDGNGYNGGTRVSSWDNENTTRSSHWMVYEVEYTADELQAILDERPTAAEAVAKVSENFISLFNEIACYTPKYSSLAEAQATAAYQALTDEMQQLVDKIYDKTYGSGWGEANADNTKEAWDATYAKKFRVQMYEPYSIAGDITSWLGINSHANNDNPTGIYVHQAGKVYVMVEGEIKTGATLRLVDAGSNDRITNAATGGYALQQGLNVIEFTQAGGMLYICYNVDTYNPGGTDDATRFPHKLSEYAPLKIHIEGGAINGFYNACGDFRATTDAENLWKTITLASVDKDADWEYMETRANLSVLPILGHRQILLFQLNDTNDSDGKLCQGMKSRLPDDVQVPTSPYNRTGSWSDYGMGCDPETGKINILLEAWDRVMYSELATMGLLSEPDMAKMNDFYPRWNANGTVAAEIYDYSETSDIDGKTLEQFCGVDYSDVFNHHGVALGTTSGYMYGGGDHCGYNINTFDGIIKTFASNAGSTWGPGHEIGHQHQALLTLNGLMEVTNNLFSNIALWYKGMSTSRYNGNEGSLEQVLKAFNTDGGDTYTNNIWALTHMYYRLWLYYHLAGNNTQFYPRLFELLRHDPMVRTYMQDGDVSMLHFYKLVCQAAGEDLTEFFRAHGYFTVMENRLVGDYSNSVYNLSQQMIDKAIAEVKAMRDAEGNPLKENLSIIFINDDDETANYVQHDGQTKREIYGETNPNSDFGSVTDFIAGNEATTPYTATLNSDGTITMSDGEGGVGFLILNDKGEIVSFSNKTTFELGEKAKLALISGKATIVSVSSDNNVAPVEAEVDLSVVKRTLLGDLIAEVETVIDNVDDTYKKVGCYKPTAVVDLATLLNSAKKVYAGGTAFEGIYEILHSEYKNVVNNPTSLIGVISGKRYAIKSRSGNDYMTVSGTNVVTTGNSTLPTTDDNLWIIETSGENYHIKHAGTEKYLQGVSDANSVSYTVGSTAVDYKMTRIENGYYALSTAEHSTRYMNRHAADNIATWNSTDANSQWTITLADAVTEDVQNMAKLELLASQTRKLLDKIAYVDYIGDAYPLQADYSSEDYYITSNATENGHEPKYLLDNTTGTFFHTVWAGGSPGEAHYLQVDMGEENEIDQFVFSYSTIGQTNVDAPKTIEVKGSNSPDSGFQPIATLGDGSLPTTHLTSYTSGVLGAVGTKYRYLRFTVTNATGGTLGGYYYFGISELAIRRTNFKFNSINNGYDGVDEDVVMAAIEKYEDARSAMTNGSGYTAALSSLQTAYDNLLAEYNEKILATRKETLAALVEATTPLIGQVGTLEFATLTPLTLTAENLYCNEVRADDCTSNGATADNSATGYVKNLTDGNNDTFLHTNYNNAGAVNPPHYLRVDLGENSAVKNFSFNYVTRNNGNNCPTTIVVEGCNTPDGTYTEIRTLTDGLPNGSSLSFDSGVITSSVAYRYIRIKVTGVEGGGATFFVMAEFGFSIMGENNISVKDRYAAVVSEDLLLSIYSVNEASKTMCESTVGLTMEMLDTQIAEQTAAKKNLEDAIASVTIDKRALQELYDLALPLYDRMADANGAIRAEYEPSALTVEMLSSAKTALDAALAQLNDENTSQDAVDAAKVALQAKYDELLGIEDANLNEDGRAGLDSKIAEIEAFLATIATENEGEYTLNSYYENVAGLGFDELCSALQQARNLYNRFYLTEEECNDVKDILTGCQSATQAVVNADITGRGDLTTLIGNANTLLNDIAAKGEEYYSAANLSLDNLRSALDAAASEVSGYLTAERYVDLLTQLQGAYDTTNGIVALDCNSENRNNLSTLIGNVNTLLANIANAGETTVALPMQATNENEAFYIWCYDPAGDSDGVAGLIDKNADGTANTGTFLGTNWGADVPAYTHYIEIDLGVAGTIDQLTMDYTTRNSTHADQRPTAIKILGSNDKTNYTEITEITSGLAANANEKWSMGELLDLGGRYRYIRIAVGSQRGFFHMSDFNLYTKLSHTLEEYYTTAEGLDFITLCLALDEASDAAAHYMTTEQYTTVYNKLNGCYTTADGVVDNDYKGDRDAFATLRTETETLVNDVVAIDETETVIALQCDDVNAPYYIYCNAPGATNNYEGDDLGVAVLLDVDDNGEPITATFLHTTYTGNSHDDALDHYLRVDMGESNLLSFKFRYTPRIGNTGNAPLVMLIEGSNDCVNFEEITTLTDMATTYQSGEIRNGKAYRYIRFMVKDTHNHSAYDGHKFFAMSHFEMTACKTVTISQEYASPNLPVDVAANANNEVADANALDVEHYLPSEVGVAAQAELQAAYDALNAAIALKNIPVKLTTDVNNPVLYKIRINRSYANYASLQYDASDSKVAVAAMEFETANAQSWYFMQGTDGESYDDILILPYTAGGKVLATNSFSEGNSKVVAKDKDTKDFSQNWEISKIDGMEWYNIKIKNTDGTYYYFSNHGGDGNKMGFYNSNASSDGGSMFKFILDEAYAIVEEAFASYTREPGYTNVPGYPDNSDYNTAYDALANYVENKSGEDAKVFGALQALVDAKTAMTYVPSHAPEHGAVYRIMNLIINTETRYKYHYIANNNATIAFPTERADDGSDLWVCKANEDGTYEFVSALGTATLGWDYTIKETNAGAVKENATKFVVDDNTSVNGAKRIAESNYSMSLTNELWNSKGEALFNRAGNNGKAQSDNWSTDWYFQKVEDADVKFNVNISSRRFSSLYLPYDVEVPEGVSAFTAVNVDGNNVDLYRVADRYDDTAANSIIPARTPVILYLEDEPFTAGAYTFTYAPGAEALSDAVAEKVDAAIIFGKILQTHILCDLNTRYYKLGGKSGDTVSKMYWMYKEYDSEGTITNPGTDDGGYIRCSANKIYMTVAESVASNSFSMRFGIDSGTTDINEVDGENGEVKAIYDMQGRKLTEITMPGMYIVNGKKVYVK